MNWFKIIIAIGILIACSSIAFYFLFLLPSNQQAELKFKKEQDFNRQFDESKRRIDLDNCLDTADLIYSEDWKENCKTKGIDNKNENCSLPSFTADSINKALQIHKDNCFKQYPKD